MHFRVLKMIATSGFLKAVDSIECINGRGSVVTSWPRWRSLQHSPRPSSWFKGPTSKGREGRKETNPRTVSIDVKPYTLTQCTIVCPKASWAGLICDIHQHYHHQWLPNTEWSNSRRWNEQGILISILHEQGIYRYGFGGKDWIISVRF